jgi:hypothetical protein
MVKLIDKAIVINGKIFKNKRNRFYSSNKEGFTFDLLRQKNYSKLLNLYLQKLNPKSKNIQTDASCTKLVVGFYFNKT